MTREGPSRGGIAAWVVYDLANTMFSFVIVSFDFPVWLAAAARDAGFPEGRADSMLGVATGASMLVVALAAPVLGALSDSAKRRMPFLVASTLACVAATAFLGRTPVLAALVVFAVANALYNLSLVFYDSLLPDVSTPATRGRVGGIGVAVGYLGSFLGIGAGLLLVDADGSGRPALFLATAATFLALALPCFFLVKERDRPRRARERVLASVASTVRATALYPGLRRFLVARFFFADAANTLIAFMGIYLTQEVGFPEGGSTTRLLLAAAIVGAIAGGFAFGRIADAWGPKRGLYVVMTLWLVTFAGAIAVPVLSLAKETFWAVAILAGISLGGSWATDRPFMLRLAPADRVGEFYGLYALAGRFAAVAGPLLWAGIVALFTARGWPFARPAAVATLAVMMIVAMVLLRGVSDEPAVGASRAA